MCQTAHVPAHRRSCSTLMRRSSAPPLLPRPPWGRRGCSRPPSGSLARGGTRGILHGEKEDQFNFPSIIRNAENDTALCLCSEQSTLGFLRHCRANKCFKYSFLPPLPPPLFLKPIFCVGNARTPKRSKNRVRFAEKAVCANPKRRKASSLFWLLG